ncbi:hypothetical protein ACRCJU_02765 [Aerococcus urinaeequi]|uniref:hypothetical protein n=1 Tax=Aerococcus urinaeequi TaxID=51665 RepID=UPI003D6A1018
MNLQEELKALKERIAELEEQAKEEQEFPRDGDRYWYMTTTGKIFTSNWDGFDFYFDEAVLEIGNIFQTKEQAEFAVEKLRVEAELRKFSRPFELDSYNHYIFLDTYSDCLGVDSLSYCQSQGTIHFESEEKANEAIETVGEKRIKKYIFGVED